jgi:hypothetical protein
MCSASSADARTLAAKMRRQLHQYRTEYTQLEASMRWRLERELEAKRAVHADLVARMSRSITTLERTADTGATSSVATVDVAAATPTGAEAPNPQAPGSQSAHQTAMLSHPRPTAMATTSAAFHSVDWMRQSPICCLLSDDLLERISNELQSGVVWQTCAFLRHRRLNSIEALVLSSCKLQTLVVPTGGSRDALVLRLWHQLNAGRVIMRQLRNIVDEAAAAADQATTLMDMQSLNGCAYGYAKERDEPPWKSRFDAIDEITTADGPALSLLDLSSDVQPYFAGDLLALLRDKRPRASKCMNGGIKQEFFHHLRDCIFEFLRQQVEPHLARLLIEGAEDIIDPPSRLPSQSLRADIAEAGRVMQRVKLKIQWLYSEIWSAKSTFS